MVGLTYNFSHVSCLAAYGLKIYKIRKKFESVHLACARKNRTSVYTCLPGDLVR